LQESLKTLFRFTVQYYTNCITQ